MLLRNSGVSTSLDTARQGLLIKLLSTFVVKTLSCVLQSRSRILVVQVALSGTSPTVLIFAPGNRRCALAMNLCRSLPHNQALLTANPVFVIKASTATQG
jgi:hypothetical protein